jgi:SAM-dependent methyltransferase
MSDSYFDEYAGSYDRDLHKALSVSGENKNYFAEGRMKWLSAELAARHLSVNSVLDFGCGTGSATPFIRACFSPTEIVGADVSLHSLEVATAEFGTADTKFIPIERPLIDHFDLAFCNGVFHHIDPEQRQESLSYVFQSLRPGGLFALFENNPWNPATLYVMSRCAFDKDAITLPPTETRRRMRNAGFEILTTRFLFIFPAILRLLRPLENPLSPLPFGTQYVVIGRKP